MTKTERHWLLSGSHNIYIFFVINYLVMFHLVGIFAGDYIWYLISGFEPRYYAEFSDFRNSDLSNFWFTLIRGSLLVIPFQLVLFAMSWVLLSIFYRKFVTRVSGLGFWFFLFSQWLVLFFMLYIEIFSIIKRNGNINFNNLTLVVKDFSIQAVQPMTIMLTSFVFWVVIKFLTKKTKNKGMV